MFNQAERRVMKSQVRSWSSRIGIVAGVVIAMSGLVLALPAAAGSTTVTYTANITIPVPPASNFAGSAGGDGCVASCA